MKLIRQKYSIDLFFLLLVSILSYIAVSISLILSYQVPFGFFISYNLTLYLCVIISLYKNKLLFFFDAWFVLFFPIYYIVNSMLYLFYSINIFSLDYSVFYYCFVICFTTWMLCFITFLIRPKLYDKSFYISVKKHSELLFNKKNNYSLLFLLGGACSIFFYQKVSGLGDAGVLNSSRLELVNKIDDSGWYLKYFMIAYTWYISALLIYFYKSNQKIKKTTLILFLPVLIYFYSLLVVGSRREIVFCLIFVVLFFFLLNRGVFSHRVKLFSLIGAIAVFLFGTLRHTEDSSQVTLLLNTFGEFVFPINTLLYHYSLDYDFYEYGVTYFNFITNFIPKFIYPEKPLPLAVDFATMLATPGQDFVMGYAFTPISESFVNFGILSILLFPLILWFMVFICEVLVIKYPLFLVILLTQVVNFQRSDVASLIFELSLLGICFIFCNYVTRFKFRVSN